MAGTAALWPSNGASAAALPSARTVGTVRIDTAGAIRIFENANTRLELSRAGIAIAMADGRTGAAALGPTNFRVLADGSGRIVQASHHFGPGFTFANEALSVSVTGRSAGTKKVSGTLTIILANYY